MDKPYFLSFTEEFVMNPHYAGYIGGRVEVYNNEDTGGNGYAIDEIRFFTKNVDAFYEFRDLYDFADVDEDGLASIRAQIAAMFCNEVK